MEEITRILKMLKKLVKDTEVIETKGELNYSVKNTLVECYSYVVSDENVETPVDSGKLLEIESVIDFLYEEINTGHWSEVPIYMRQYYTAAQFIKSLIILKHAADCSEQLFTKCLECIDMGLLLGCPLDNNKELLSNAAKLLTTEINKINRKELTGIGTAKRKLEGIPSYDKISAKEVDVLECPSLESFNKHYFCAQVPVKIKERSKQDLKVTSYVTISDCMEHWPAMKKWQNVDYLLGVAGERTVPIEIGSHYADEGWSQKLMKLKDFILKYYVSESSDVGYLAQHNLFDQIAELKEDIRIPEYCCLSLDYNNDTETELDVNAWFGPGGTVSPLHQDPKNNILSQVFGTKQILLYSPDDSPYLYPHEEKLLNNTAQVDPLKPDLDHFPEFHKAKMYKCLLEPGDMLFIPVKWWHHVTALDKSFSVSFWWM
ncbi:unnamed protein product [Callosobruchus maculatus]|uniref:JmjC domain-containing protein n=1 Tax=Callosobruchus maculatus TaxID=64391 RepID=A0A653C226_CALMS|nr:unnamed protein product [Callosobruchus maculatus]